MSQAATSSDRDYDAIRDTIFDYFDGVRLADRKRLEQAFAVDAGHMKGYLKGADGTWTLSVRPMREVIDTSLPVNCAIMRSTGPPGANWITAKLISMMPISVGKISRIRFRRYAAMSPA